MADATTTTPTATFPATGKIISSKDGILVFNPSGTSYEFVLANPTFNGPLNTPVQCIIRVTARKVYTVPSGGNFVSPIFGTPRIVQGLVRAGDRNSLVVHAGCPFHVELPVAESAIDLTNGPISVGRMVNVVCLPGARVEMLS